MSTDHTDCRQRAQSADAQSGDAENLGAATVPDADKLLDQASVTSSYGSLTTDKISQAEQLYVTNVVWILLAQGTFAQVIRRNVRNLTYSADQHISLTTWQRAYLITWWLRYCPTAGELHGPPVVYFHACFPVPPLIA